MSRSLKPVPLTAQPKTAGAALVRVTPTAPTAYRPLPVPRVLQTKTSASPHIISQSPHAPATHRINRPQPTPSVLQTKTTTRVQIPAQPETPSRHAAPSLYRPQLAIHTSQVTQLAIQRQAIVKHGLCDNRQTAATTRHIVQRAVNTSQAFKSAVVQATKYYPNLHPGAAVPVERSNIFSLDNFASQYRLHRAGTHSVNVPNMKYNFVRTREGEMLLHNRYRHPSLAEGQQVLYAGEVFFNNGTLQWWSNGSGHYQPDADGAEQANLPMDYFYSYQQVIKGEHTRRKG